MPRAQRAPSAGRSPALERLQRKRISWTSTRVALCACSRAWAGAAAVVRTAPRTVGGFESSC